MKKKAETYDLSFKKKAVGYLVKKRIMQLFPELNVHRKNIQRWVKQFSEDGVVGLRETRGRKSKSSTISRTVENTQQKIKRLEAENELLKKLLKM